jgi:hypothetical protein
MCLFTWVMGVLSSTSWFIINLFIIFFVVIIAAGRKWTTKCNDATDNEYGILLLLHHWKNMIFSFFPSFFISSFLAPFIPSFFFVSFLPTFFLPPFVCFCLLSLSSLFRLTFYLFVHSFSPQLFPSPSVGVPFNFTY